MNKKDRIEQTIAFKRKLLEKAKYCFGITSITQDGKHIIMLDFDNINYSAVYDTVLDIQKNNNLSTFYIIRSNGGYNAFSLDKRPLEKINDMLKPYNLIDPLFKKLSFDKRKLYVLRMGIDKIFYNKIRCFADREQLSFGHYLFFKYTMGFPIEKNHHYDSFRGVKIIGYKSVKHGFCDIPSLNNLKEFKSEYITYA